MWYAKNLVGYEKGLLEGKAFAESCRRLQGLLCRRLLWGSRVLLTPEAGKNPEGCPCIPGSHCIDALALSWVYGSFLAPAMDKGGS